MQIKIPKHWKNSYQLITQTQNTFKWYRSTRLAAGRFTVNNL